MHLMPSVRPCWTFSARQTPTKRLQNRGAVAQAAMNHLSFSRQSHRLGVTAIKPVEAATRQSQGQGSFDQAQQASPPSSGFDRCRTVCCEVHGGSGVGCIAGFCVVCPQTDKFQVVVLHEIETRHQEQGNDR